MVPESDAERDRILTDPPSALENELCTKLEALVPGVRVLGVAGTGPVDLVAVKWVRPPGVDIMTCSTSAVKGKQFHLDNGTPLASGGWQASALTAAT
ncbi:MAG: hypothetical protein LH624_10435 [Cryobacterium sp.]|nr:hypothetical protein [Cryobacterium sp.]